MDVASFKCLADSDLDHYEKRVKEYGIAVDHVKAGEQPGVGRRIGFTIPSGHRIELYAHADQSDPKPRVHNPDVWEVEPHGMCVRRFDHSLLYGPDIEKVLDFFTKALDFRCAERVDMPDGLLAIWLTCSMKAHDIAFVKHPEPAKLHHVAFELENWSAVGHAADIITHYDISIDIGPTRHGITRGQTIYFFDPRATAARCSPAATPTIRTTRPAPGTRPRSARASSITSASSTRPSCRSCRSDGRLRKTTLRASRRVQSGGASARKASGGAVCAQETHIMQVALARHSISSAAAFRSIEAAIAKGRERDVAVVVTVVDIGGDLMACLRADGAFSASIGISKDKAYTAAVFGAATDDLSNALKDNPVLHHGIAIRPGVVLFGGGLPIVVDGALIGAIGVSGGSEDDDRACAKAGALALSSK